MRRPSTMVDRIRATHASPLRTPHISYALRPQFPVAPTHRSGDLLRIMPDRRYSEEEVAAIFERAAEAQQSARRHLAAGEVMTLADLHEIGSDVGFPTDLLVQAA